LLGLFFTGDRNELKRIKGMKNPKVTKIKKTTLTGNWSGLIHISISCDGYTPTEEELIEEGANIVE